MMFDGSKIPQSMKKRQAWVCWKYVERDGKQTKTPINPKTGGNAMSNEPGTWGSYMMACAHKAQANLDGVGFMFGDGFVGVDIDHCINTETGEIDPTALKIVRILESYTERSPSGTGIHIICMGKLPPGGRKNTKIGLEMYDAGRFFTVTGDVLGEAKDVQERTEALQAVHVEHMKPEQIEKPKPARTSDELPMDDLDLMRKMFDSNNGAEIESLFDGAWRGKYESQSEADLALCNALAFWCACDETQMDRIFRKSALYRDKWDDSRNGSSYGRDTITKAIRGTTDVYHKGKSHSIEEQMPDPGTDPTEAAPEAEDADADIPVMFAHEAIPVDAAYVQGSKRYQPDDTGNAERFVDLYGKNARYCHTNKSWYLWNNRVWMRDISGGIKRMADQAINVMRREAAGIEDSLEYKQVDRMMRRVRSSTGKEAMIKETQHLSPISQDDMDKDDALVNLANGIYDLDAGQLLPHARERYMTRICQAEFDANASQPKRWLAFISEILGDDEKLIRFMQKALGYSLSGFAVEQCFFVLYGTGANGKSTLLDVVRDLMGGYLQNAQAETVMVRERSNGSQASGDIARLKGCRFVTCSETEEGRKLSEALIKQMTGDGAITCRFLFSEEFEYVPKFKIWLATNHKPVIKGGEVGIWRRIHMIPFRVTIPDERRDPHLVSKLKEESAGILNWMLEGYRMWRAEGLKPPAVVKEATAEYRSEMDIVKQFLDEATVPNDGSKMYLADIYAHYRKWCDMNGERPLTSVKFSVKMSEQGWERRRVSQGVIYDGHTLSAAWTKTMNRGMIGGERDYA